MKKQLWILAAIAVLSVWACNRGGEQLKEIDLMPFGIAVSVKAPADTIITAGSLGDMQEAVIGSKDSSSMYSMQVIQAPAMELDLAMIVEKSKEEITSDTLSNITVLEESADGFLFEYAYDDETKGYDFRRFRLQGDKLITFQTTLGLFHSKKAASLMYKAAAK